MFNFKIKCPSSLLIPIEFGSLTKVFLSCGQFNLFTLDSHGWVCIISWILDLIDQLNIFSNLEL